MITLAVTGARGRMGREVIDIARNRTDVELVLAVNRGSRETVNGVEIESAADLPTLLNEHDPTVLIDFSGPESTLEYVAACVETGIAVVIGTTGFTDVQHSALREMSRETAVLIAPNFARGVQVLINIVEEAVANLPDYDIEVMETHHNRKRDAPSGTAIRILEAIESERESVVRVHGREGEALREPSEIGVHARRAGNTVGEHEVLIAGNHEEVSISHRAGQRGVFAVGAIDAAVWLADRPPGWYDFAEVIDE